MKRFIAVMLDIIFDNRIYDIGAYYAIGDFSMQIIMLTMKDSTDIAFLFKKRERMAGKQIEKLYKDYEKLD